MQSPQCISCKHYRGMDFTCDAFPSGIPTEIFTGIHDHLKPFDGDRGILWEEFDTEEEQDAE